MILSTFCGGSRNTKRLDVHIVPLVCSPYPM